LVAFQTEFERRAFGCITDLNTTEVNGVDFLKLKEWTNDVLGKEGADVEMRFETMLENVNYNMAQAQETFK